MNLGELIRNNQKANKKEVTMRDWAIRIILLICALAPLSLLVTGIYIIVGPNTVTAVEHAAQAAYTTYENSREGGWGFIYFGVAAAVAAAIYLGVIQDELKNYT